jgi:adenylosuccinate synthase
VPAIVLVGSQWGDEGKGKATDLLSNRLDYVVKFNGGNNAGHTVVIGDEKYALHLLPSGILTPGVTPVISNGVVVDIEVLFDELETLTARGVDISQLLVSASAHVITPYHKKIDKITERFLGKRQIGTTGRGIGPAYADKINRVGIRIQDLFDENILRQKVEGALHQKNHLLVKVYNRRAISVDEIVDGLLSYVPRLGPMVADTSLVLNRALDLGKTVLFEGGQATMLDVDHGTYPFVTSSNATSGGAATGSGVAPNRIDRVIGVVKAYTTRVGAGPFPTELLDDSQLFGDPTVRGNTSAFRNSDVVGNISAGGGTDFVNNPGEYLRSNGHEFGTTTGRPRRTGWYDAPIARYTKRINGVTDFVLTKLDVLTGLPTIPVCVAYDIDGRRFDEVPVSQSDFHHAKPIYEEFPGWQEDITGVRNFDELPLNAQRYVLALEAMSGSRVSAIGVGPARDAIVVRHDLVS